MSKTLTERRSWANNNLCYGCGENPPRILSDPIPEGEEVMFSESLAGRGLYCQECFDASDDTTANPGRRALNEIRPVEHEPLGCQNPACDYDMRKDGATVQAVAKYLTKLAVDVRRGQVRHVSLSVHRTEP